jgi:hypothetical protein
VRPVLRHGVRAQHVLAASAVLLLALFALALSAGDAPATKEYVHGPIGPYGCDACHLNYHTESPPTNDYCQVTCHTDYQVVRSSDLCWTCHAPGQDMSWARSDASCLATCHLRGDVTFAHAAHAGGSAGCTSCHTLTVSPEDSAGSAHHTVPAPRLDSMSPSAAAPGASVKLSGAQLSYAALVRFGDIDAAFDVVSDELIVATVPQSASSAPVTVLTAGGTATSAAPFVVLRPEPPQTQALSLAGIPKGIVLGRRVRLHGERRPASVAGQVKVTVLRRVTGTWKVAASAMRPLGADGKFAWSYRPRRAGAYKARASVAGLTSRWVAFRVSRP